ncbi:LD-carboxypeptidase [Vandammella animalimorsus]|uniref:LD-carboxypeptidase n=1 Tax=Vandammella animalimorsus TaxID=2029117 RepID=A0A3M6R6K3_9BURK|nr:LD-carboxypeptidase [Vandammella animalimorsus]RMX10379.1 LD-carboxypeptidase [Vandammella animalimorsus]
MPAAAHSCAPACACHAQQDDGHGQRPERARQVYVYSPSGAVRDRAALRRGVRRLEKAGFAVTLDEGALLRDSRFAGTHAQRLDALHRAARSGADVALISRGGYGLNHLLPHMDYALLARAIAQGTQFMGFSDFTALQLALLAHTGAISWAGASLCVDFGTAEPPDEITQACFEDVAHGIAEGAGWRIGKECAAAYQGLHIEQARLWGGNLAVLASLIGTPHLPAIEGGILFLEDVGEAPYRVERMLVQLEQAGILARQQALLLGHFTEAPPAPRERGYHLGSIVAALRERTGLPVLTGLPFGHVRTKVCLPVGAKVQLQVSAREAMLVWGHF